MSAAVATSTTATFPIVPAPATALIFPVLLLAGMALATARVWRNPDVPTLVRVILAGTCALVALALGAAVTGTRYSRVEVGPAGVRLRGDLWGRTIAAAQLRTDRARVVDLNVERGLRPAMRTAGTGLPGYGAGWFRLEDGSRALLYLTDQRRVVYVPTTGDYAVLLSAADPDGLVAAIRALPGTAARGR